MFSLPRTLYTAPYRVAGRCALLARPATRFYSDAAAASSPTTNTTTTTPPTETTTTQTSPKLSKPSVVYANSNGSSTSSKEPRSQPAKSTTKSTTKTASASASVSAAAPSKPAAAATAAAGKLPTYAATTIAFAPNKAHANKYDIDVDWANSYHGISTRPVNVEQFKVLMRPLDEHDIEVKPDGVLYLPEIKYRRRLNEAFGPMGWGMIPKGEPVVGENIVTREYALIIDGRFVSQAQGENNYFGPDNLPSAVEGCKSNALMRCCKDLGIASELWDPQFIRAFNKVSMEEVWVENAASGKKRLMWFRKGQVKVPYPWKRTK